MSEKKLKAELNARLNRERIRINARTKEIEFGRLELNDRHSMAIINEIAKKYRVELGRIIPMINELRDQKLVRYSVQEVINVKPKELPLYSHLKVYHSDGHNAENIEELLKVDQQQYLLVSHTRNSLKPGDLLQNSDSIWAKNDKIIFQALRQSKAVKEGFHYQTSTINKIELLHPSDILKELDQ